jgi:hypothetical protein
MRRSLFLRNIPFADPAWIRRHSGFDILRNGKDSLLKTLIKDIIYSNLLLHVSTVNLLKIFI